MEYLCRSREARNRSGLISKGISFHSRGTAKTPRKVERIYETFKTGIASTYYYTTLDMIGNWQQWKQKIRYGFKYSKAIFRGHSFYYTCCRNPNISHQYPYLWYASSTPIPNRGTLEIQQNRIWNLQFAGNKINNLQIAPNQIFNFYYCVGEPSSANGFREGPIFVNGKVTIGTGGGLCLIATNVFNTFLFAGCQVLERHCHSIDAYGEERFYELGQDAAVAYGYKDLVVRNCSNIPLQLRFQVLLESHVISSSLWGKLPSPYQVRVESKTLAEIRSFINGGVSGWAIETKRHVRSIQDEGADWYCDYAEKSIYQPCTPT